MTLTAGVRLGPYEILDSLGSGGMGEVYRARDTRLDRTVAIKVLPASLASDLQFRERFDREARAISQLDHPHICALYDVGEQDGTAYLVMQYLEGETLESRLKKGALPPDQATQFAIQVADALDKAHRAGIVHRDVKPGNIMLTKFGAKLLDFGLARAATPIGAAGGPSMLPTTPPGLTAQGTILGTFQYMAPEQLEGHEADARTDIFAFGAVVYEMLTGKKAFEGKSHASLIAAILTASPPAIASLQPLTPAALDHVIARCLAKDPDERWQTASDLARELRWAASANVRATAGVPAGQASKAGARSRLAWVVAAVAVAVAVAVGTVGLYIGRTASVPVVTRLELATPAKALPFGFALSPDGRHLAYVAGGEGQAARLWVRSFDQPAPRVLAGTEGARYPFWSPDSRTIALFTNGKLNVVELSGGAPRPIADALAGYGGTWNRDGVIVYAGGGGSPLMQVAAAGGGTPVPVTRLAKGELSHRWAQFLPDGQRFLFFVYSEQPEKRGMYIGSLRGDAPKFVLATDTAAEYAPPGYLFQVSNGVLVARAFDAAGSAPPGDAVRIAEPVGADPEAGFRAAFTVSAGALAYWLAEPNREQLVWIDRSGKPAGVLAPPRTGLTTLVFPELSPDGQHVALYRNVRNNPDVWVVDVDRRMETPFTTGQEADLFPVWSPDGTRIVFMSNRHGHQDLFEKPFAGTTDERPILESSEVKVPQAWSPGFLVYAAQNTTTGTDLWVLPMTGTDRKPFFIVQTRFDEGQAQLSPDGRWIAYASNKTGEFEVYVTSFPTAGNGLRVSTNGGMQPRWRRDGRELFYVAHDGNLMAVPILGSRTESPFKPGTPIVLFRTQLAQLNMATGNGLRPQYAVAADGRFLMNVMVDETRVTSPISVVLNWAAAIKR